jgi:hypothetical protein
LIQDLHVQGKVTLVDLKPGVTFNHVVDHIYVDETQTPKVKDFVHTYSELTTEASGKLKWKDTPIRPPGNVLHCVNKKDLTVAFTDVWDARGVTIP